MDNKMSKPLIYAYQYWYKSSPTARTEYIKIIATSEKQAYYFFKREGYTYMYDYATKPSQIEFSFAWQNKYHVGEIWNGDRELDA